MTVPSEFGVRETDLVELVVPNDLQSARQVEKRIMDRLARCRYGAAVTFAIKLALEEALTNAVKHGNDNDASRQLVVRYSVDRERTIIMVRDEGLGFAPTGLPDPTSDENLERPSGRGIMLMQAYMTRVHFNDAGNEVWMLKTNPQARSASPA
ncbi:MAG: ATP-binding protein [Phycisphaerae bacterium]